MNLFYFGAGLLIVFFFFFSDTIKWCGIFKNFVEFTLKNGEISEFIDCVKEHKNTYIHEKKEVMWPDVVTILTTAKDLEDSHIPLVMSLL